MSITLSGGVDRWFTDQFHDVLYLVSQQKGSKFAQAVRVKPILNAEDKAFDMLGRLTLVEKSERNPDTPVQDATTQRRWVSTTPYHQSVRKDKDDDLSMIIDPTSDFVRSFRYAINRQKDTIILAAFEAAVTSGRRAGSTITWANQDGNTKYTAPDTGRTIAHDCSSGNCNASDTGMTVEKLELAQEYFMSNDVDENIPKWCCIGPRQATNLWGQEEYINIDYAADKPITTGYIRKNWMGFNWIVSTLVTLGSSNDVDSTTNVYECWCWAQDGIILGVQDDLTTRITELPETSYSQQIYVHMNMGAMRMDEDKVIKIECQA